MNDSLFDKGCLWWLIGLPLILASIITYEIFKIQIHAFIKANSIIIIFAVLIIVIIAFLSIKLHLYIKNNKKARETYKANLNYLCKEYRNSKREFINYKLESPDYKEKFEKLKKENTEIKNRNKYLEDKIIKTESERSLAVKNLKSAYIEKIIHLYHINVDYKHVSKTEDETKAEEYNKCYPLSKSFDGYYGYADIDIVYLKGEKTNKIILLHDLFFDNNRVSCEHFDNNVSKKDMPVKNILYTDSFSYVVSNKGNRYIVRLSDYSITKNFDKYYKTKICINNQNKKTKQ